MSDAIIVALIAAAGSLGGAGVGAYFANRRTTALITYRLDELEKKMDKHNNVIERTYALEEKTAVQDEQIKVANHRIADLEKQAGRFAGPDK